MKEGGRVSVPFWRLKATRDCDLLGTAEYMHSEQGKRQDLNGSRERIFYGVELGETKYSKDPNIWLFTMQEHVLRNRSGFILMTRLLSRQRAIQAWYIIFDEIA